MQCAVTSYHTLREYLNGSANEAFASHWVRIWKQVCSCTKSRNAELCKNITSLVSFGRIVSHSSLVSLSEYWALTLEAKLFHSIDTISPEAFCVLRFFLFLFFCYGDVKFVGHRFRVSHRRHIWNYWVTNDIPIHILCSSQKWNTVAILTVTVALYDQMIM